MTASAATESRPTASPSQIPWQIRQHSDVYRTRPARISWKVPLFMNNDWIALRLLQYCQNMGVDRPFDIVFGAPRCKWAGGRPSAIRQELTPGQVEAYFGAYDRFGVKPALTLSRLIIDASDLADPYGNMLLETANRYHAQAIIADDGLLTHVRENYPNITTIASLDKVMCELKDDYTYEIPYYFDLLERFDEVVIRCEVGLDDGLLSQLEPVADRVEIITNQVCMPNCQFYDRHIASMEALNDSEQSIGQSYNCFYERDAKDFPTWLATNLTIPESRICELTSHGFTKLKLGGRNAPQPKALDTLGRYVFEPNGVFWQLQNALAREYRSACEKAGQPLAPWTLPE